MKFILLVALLSLVCHSVSIRVGFYSANIEGFQYSQSEFKNIFDLFKVIDGKKGNEILNISVMQSDDIKKPNTSVLNNYDLILISLQETSYFQNIEISDIFKDNKDWQCHPMQYKNGFTKAIPKLTAVAMCNNKKTLKYYFDKTPFRPVGFGSLIPTDLKAVFGRCFEDMTSKNKEVLCFLGGHLETDLINGAKRIGRLYKYIEDKIDNKPYSFYVLGDLNVRNWIKIDEKNVGELKTNVEKKDLTSYVSGDKQALLGFEAELSKSITKGSHFFSFTGNDNLRSLPFTYNYHVPDSKTNVSNFDTKHFRLDCATQYKKAVEGKDVSNYGWLDRLACGYNKLKGSCKIKGGDENVNYFMVPFLRKADHMPMIGSFEISSDVQEEVKKNEIITESQGSVSDIKTKFEGSKEISMTDDLKRSKSGVGIGFDAEKRSELRSSVKDLKEKFENLKEPSDKSDILNKSKLSPSPSVGISSDSLRKSGPVSDIKAKFESLKDSSDDLKKSKTDVKVSEEKGKVTGKSTLTIGNGLNQLNSDVKINRKLK